MPDYPIIREYDIQINQTALGVSLIFVSLQMHV